MNVLLERVWPIPPCLPTFSPWFFLLGLPHPPISPPKVLVDHLWAHCRTIAWMVLYHLYAWTCPWPQPGSFNFSEPRKLVSGSMFGGMRNTWPVKISESTWFFGFSSKLGNGPNTGKIRILVRISTAFYGQNTVFVRVGFVVRTRYVQNMYFVRIWGFSLKSSKIPPNPFKKHSTSGEITTNSPKPFVLYLRSLKTRIKLSWNQIYIPKTSKVLLGAEFQRAHLCMYGNFVGCHCIKSWFETVSIHSCFCPPHTLNIQLPRSNKKKSITDPI